MNFFILVVGLVSLGISLMLDYSCFLVKFFVVTSKIMNIPVILKFDNHSLLFFGILMIIVFSVKNFSEFYLEHDKTFNRFFWLLMVFVGSMCIMIFFPKLLMVLVGWDGLGLASFFLMVYYSSSKSWACGLKTYLMKRFGDGLLIFFVVMLFNQGHWSIFMLDKIQVKFFGFVLCLGLVTKSAQFPFCSWLPAAMAAPTPVSALVHSSTLVTAGMYLLFRLKKMFSWEIKLTLGMIGLYTLLVASFSACFEWDLKKMIAFSTLSQLGLMCVSLSLGLSLLAFFHLLTHAVFKALLFISAGFFIGQLSHFQDLRTLGKTKGFNPLVDFSLVLSILALSGFPFLAGFFSKDIILESNVFVFNYIFIFMLWASLPLTVYYSFRLIFFIFKKKFSGVSNYSHLSLSKIFGVLSLHCASMLLGACIQNFFKKFFFLSKFWKLFLICILGWGFLGVKKKKSISPPKGLHFFLGKIFFVEPKNASFFSNEFTSFGAEFFLLDQGVSKKKNKFFSLVSSLLSIFSLSVFNYFLKLSVQLVLVYFWVVVMILWVATKKCQNNVLVLGTNYKIFLKIFFFVSKKFIYKKKDKLLFVSRSF